jgi:hypothetical protein
MKDDLLGVLRDLAKRKSSDIPENGDNRRSVDRHYEKNEITHQQVEPLGGAPLPLIPEPMVPESENLDSMSQVTGYRTYEKNEINEKIQGCIGGGEGSGSVCCECGLPIIERLPTSWGGRPCHRDCGEAAFEREKASRGNCMTERGA